MMPEITLLAANAGPVAARPPYYSWILLAGVGLSLWYWTRVARRDHRLLLIWFGALIGAFTGAKLVYVLAEGWRDFGQPDMWRRLAAGKTVIGALLGGYGAVEGMKKLVGYRQATGDWFAIIAPAGIGLGRLGCWLNGCCLGRVCDAPAWWTVNDIHGIPRWPSVPLEFGFNVLALASLAALRALGRFPGNLFHIYLMAYGLFRFAHELVRDTPRVLGPLSGYAIAAAAVFVLGAVRFRQRQLSGNPR